MSIIKNINLNLKLGFTKISINKNFPLVRWGKVIGTAWVITFAVLQIKAAT